MTRWPAPTPWPPTVWPICWCPSGGWTRPADRRIHLDGAAEGEVLRRDRPRLRFARKVSAALMGEAVASLSQAKAMHDRLEALYNPYVDFDLVEETARQIGDEILSG